MEQTLKPCPFCGSAAEWATSTEQDDWEIQCSNWDCSLLLYGGDKTGTETETAWNTRAPDADHLAAMAAQDEQIRQLREALQAYRNPPPSLSIFHDECFLDANRNVDSRCDLCKAADALLEAK